MSNREGGCYEREDRQAGLVLVRHRLILPCVGTVVGEPARYLRARSLSLGWTKETVDEWGRSRRS